jgi:hypothetical protein
VQNWIKFYEVITKPLNVASALFLVIATSLLLTAPDSALAKLGLAQVIAAYRWVVGLGFIISATWLMVTAIIWVSRWAHRKVARARVIHREKREVEKCIPHMTPRERKIIGYLLAYNQRTLTNTLDCGYANTLVSKKIIVCALLPGQAFTQSEVPFEVPDHVWAVLSSHRAEFPHAPPKAGESAPYPWRVPWNA